MAISADIADDQEGDGDFRVPGSNSEARTLPERLRELADASGGNEALSAKSGIPLRTLGYLLAGQDAKLSQLQKLASGAGARLEWLVNGSGPMRAGMEDPKADFRAALERADELQAPPEIVMIPRYDVRSTGGPGGIAEAGKVAEYVPLPRDLIRRKLGLDPANLAIIDHAGDSMWPTLHDGDSLVVNTAQRDIADGKIYTFSTGHDLMTKRLQRRIDGSVLVTSDNDGFPPEAIRPSDQAPLYVFGEVVWRIGAPSLKRP